MTEGSSSKLHIRLHVYDTEISVNVVREDEKFYRDAAKLITDTVNTYAQFFKGKKSDKELLYMALIDLASRYEKDMERNDTVPYSNTLEKLTSEIEDILRE